MKRLLLVDGSSYLYRAFHAMPDLRNRAGQPTGAIYGMVNMLRRFKADYGAHAHCTACVFDAPGGSFREHIYPQYKANRSSMPEDLALQIVPIYEVVRALGWPVLIEAGVEADDVIGTLAVQAIFQGFDEVVISTGDKDLAQLVGPNIRLVDTMNNRIMTPQAVFEKFGVHPEQFIDYLTLVGDAVDNVPGVDKVGPKTAAKWLATYGNLAQLLQHADHITGKVGEHLRAAIEWLPTAKTLVTIRTDCDMVYVNNIEHALKTQPENHEQLASLYAQYELKQHLRDLQNHTAKHGSGIAHEAPTQTTNVSEAVGSLTPPSTVASIHVHTVYTESDFESLQAALHNALQANVPVAFDTETDTLDAMLATPVGLSFAFGAWHGYYIPLAHSDLTAPSTLPMGWVLERLKAWFANPKAPKVAQHAKFDQHVLANVGIVVKGLVADTMLASYVLEAHKSHGMDTLALRWLNHQTVPFDAVAGKGSQQKTFSMVPIEQAAPYAAEDAEVTWRLNAKFEPLLQADDALNFVYKHIELPFSDVLLAMERQGVLIDAELLQQQSQTLSERLRQLETDSYELAGGPFNLNSPKQIAELLFERLQLPVIKKTAGGAPSTDEEVLSQLAHDYPLPAKLLEHRGLAKLKNTYTDKLPRMKNLTTQRVHTHYAQAVAVTGRLASSEPNLQNIPIKTPEGRKVREAFIAPPGFHLMSADYSQIELRIMAHISEDAALIEAFRTGLDVHTATAAEIFGVQLADVNAEQRRTAKTINFGLIYGMSAFGLAANLGIARDAAKLYIDRYFARYPGVAAYMQRTREMAKQQGYVSTVFGRRLWLPEINSPNGPRRAAAERAAINAPMQGTSADLIKLAMIAIHKHIQDMHLQARMLMQVHDEVVLEVPENELQIMKTHLPLWMTEVAKLSVPLEVSIGIGRNWDEAH